MSESTETLAVDPDEQVKEDLKATIELLQTHDWGQGQDIFFDEETGRPKFCINGAIRAAVGGLMWSTPDQTFDSEDHFGSPTWNRAIMVRRAIRADLPKLANGDLVGFNDHPGRTKQEILDQLGKTMARLTREDGND